MQLSIAKWGNSLALRLPSQLARESRLGEGATVTVEVQDDGSILITPSRKRFKLSALLQGYKKGEGSAEFDWGRPMGEEI